ncbi:MAG: hypothetical protein LBF63_08170 [Treponema sp.]|jgi:hypothetical protein|nr:hypothetical protein [Treponema sp.]
MEVLLDRLILLHADDEKTNVLASFPVEKDFDSLELVYAYEPKGYDDAGAARRMIEACVRRCVPEEYRRNLEPLDRFLPSVKSLVTLSLDYNGRYLGCAHRHAPQQRHIISANFSSPGFLRQPARAGNWRVVLNVHAVVSRELRCHLQVLGREGNERDTLQMF